jgi:hypothetical protein
MDLPMYVCPLTVSPTQWADRTFAAGELGDRRRERRAVRIAAGLMRLPDAMLPLAVLPEPRQVLGHQGRKGDGPPGWKTSWRGWLEIQQLLEGVHLAAHLPP